MASVAGKMGLDAEMLFERGEAMVLASPTAGGTTHPETIMMPELSDITTVHYTHSLDCKKVSHGCENWHSDYGPRLTLPLPASRSGDRLALAYMPSSPASGGLRDCP